MADRGFLPQTRHERTIWRFYERALKRIQAIKKRMLFEGVTTSSSAVDEMVRKRHEALRQRPPDVLPPTQPNGRRGRVKPPANP